MPFTVGFRREGPVEGPVVGLAVGPSRQRVPGAASALTAGAVHGPLVRATVLGVHAPGLYLDVAGTVVPVVTADAVPLATAARLTLASADAPWRELAAGDVVLVGEGLIRLPGCDIAAARTWRPTRVRRLPSLECGSGGQGSHLRTHDGVEALLGRGPGLTPAGDDALAGILLVAHAHGVAGPVAAAVRERLGSTTAVSAALLDAAADGYAAADVVALVDAAVARDAAAVARVLPAVLAIGHTSGADLVIGIAAALRHLRPLRQLGHLCQTHTSTTHTTPIGWSAA